jgi:hypothetical protein
LEKNSSSPVIYTAVGKSGLSSGDTIVELIKITGARLGGAAVTCAFAE